MTHVKQFSMIKAAFSASDSTLPCRSASCFARDLHGARDCFVFDSSDNNPR